ncbi:hypothetical protein MPSEU_000799200 [Mayamaea pseudoterrestris]|nr:hypothetical protein MPSEU_000799200 [Mayamaea pseudoterrestris]
MKVALSTTLLLFSSVSAFAPQQHQQRAFVALRMSDSETPVKAAPKPPSASSSSSSTGGALVPIKEETVEFTAGLIGGFAGLVIGGPFLAAIGAATANYLSKMDGEATDVVQAVSKSSIQVYNYLSTLDSKYEVLSKAKAQLEKALNSLKSQDSVDPDAVAKVEKALSSTTNKIKEINDEYDLVGAGSTALAVVGDLVEKAVKKAGELNEEYQLTQKATDSLEKAVNKAKAAANDVNRP